jgi:hypothetical protein
MISRQGPVRKPGHEPGFFISWSKHEFSLEKNLGKHVSFCPLGISLQLRVDNVPSCPHVENSPVYMGKLGRTVLGFSPSQSGKEWRHRRTCLVFPSIPNPYYDDYDHVYIRLRKS